ncbi:MDR family MFS transporter [Paenibacillus eucommiae]|nr:MDR family MFS transporter [Paenibacillus eucommiae]
MISLLVGTFFAIMNETLLNIALPELTVELAVPATTLQWLSASYLLVIGVLVPASALIIQWFTTRQLFLCALLLFGIGTLICALAPGFPVMMVGRIFQAVAAGLMLPVLINTIVVLYPPEERGAAMGMVGLIIMFAPTLGPALSGLILDTLSWRWLFLIVLPFIVISFFVAYRYLVNVSEITRPKIDLLSILLSTIGFGGIVFGFSTAGEGHGGWTSPMVYFSLGIGSLSLLLFVLRQLRSKEPMLDMRTFRFPMFTITAIMMVILMMTLFSSMLLLPFLLKGALGLTALTTGLILLPGGLLNGLLSPLTGKWFDKYGPRVLIIPGAALLTVVIWLFTRITLDTSVTFIVILYILLMGSLAFIFTPVYTNGLNALPERYYSHGNAILTTFEQVSGAIGVALFISLMSSGERSYLVKSLNPEAAGEKAQALLSGVNASFTVGLGFAALTLILTLFTKKAIAPEELPAESSTESLSKPL